MIISNTITQKVIAPMERISLTKKHIMRKYILFNSYLDLSINYGRAEAFSFLDIGNIYVAYYKI